jgi:hypothetical protein
MSGGRDKAIAQERTVLAVSVVGPAASSELLVPIIFKGLGVCRVAARDSEQFYCFTSSDPEQMIDARDAEALLKTGLFRVPG